MRTGTKRFREGQLRVPSGLCLDYKGDVYATEAPNNKVSVLSKQLQFMKCLGTQQLNSSRCESDSKQRNDPRLESELYPLLFEEWRPLKLLCYSGGGWYGVFPILLLFGYNREILIADNERHDVKILYPSGHFIHK